VFFPNKKKKHRRIFSAQKRWRWKKAPIVNANKDTKKEKGGAAPTLEEKSTSEPQTNTAGTAGRSVQRVSVRAKGCRTFEEQGKKWGNTNAMKGKP